MILCIFFRESIRDTQCLGNLMLGLRCSQVLNFLLFLVMAGCVDPAWSISAIGRCASDALLPRHGESVHVGQLGSSYLRQVNRLKNETMKPPAGLAQS
jgi:hypothetical protein